MWYEGEVRFPYIVEFFGKWAVSFCGQVRNDGVCILFSMKCLRIQPVFWAALLVGGVTSQGVALEEDVHSGLPRKVLLIGLDGCRFDAIQAAETPNLDLILRRSAWSQNTEVLAENHGESHQSVMTTHGPGWTTALTGVWHDKHGICNDEAHPAKMDESPNFFSFAAKPPGGLDQYPDIFRRLQSANADFQTASLSTWRPLNFMVAQRADIQMDFEEPGRSPYLADQRAADEFSTLMLKESAPDFTFLLLSQINLEGSRGGYDPESHSYLAAIQRTDALIGQVVRSISDRVQGVGEEWLILITSDHGGEGVHHTFGFRNPAIDRTFLIAFGPTVTQGEIPGPTRLVDVAAMALDHLGFVVDAVSPALDGKLPEYSVEPPEIANQRLARSIEQSVNSIEAQFSLIEDLHHDNPDAVNGFAQATADDTASFQQMALFNSQIEQLESASFQHRQIEIDFLHKTYKYSLLAIFPIFLLTLLGLVLGEIIHGRCLEKAMNFFALGMNIRNPLQMVKSSEIESERHIDQDDFSWIEEQEAAMESASHIRPSTVRKWTIQKRGANVHT